MTTDRVSLRPRGMLALALVLVLPFGSRLAAQQYTYAVEVNDVLCGYAELSIAPAAQGGLVQVVHRVYAQVSLLGSAFDVDVNMTYQVDPRTQRFTAAKFHVRRGDTESEIHVAVEPGRARLSYPGEGEDRVVTLQAGAILESPHAAPHLLRDFAAGDVESATYTVFDVQEARVKYVRYTRVGRESLQLLGRTWETIVLDSVDVDTGMQMRQWIELTEGLAVKLQMPGNRLVYLAEPAVKKQVQLVDLDATISTRTNVVIPDLQGICYMKVRAVLEPIGLSLDVAALNVPGQRFEGTIEGNRVEGVFTIEHDRYDGHEAPGFPVSAAPDPELAGYLQPDLYVQSADPVLVAHALEVTAGAANCWEAACRLSRWVADNIDYAIPGGGNARKTFDTRAGECGAHSMLLAALCRAVDIPARVVWGAMYAPNFGGSFGQHGWTEVHMGAAGWIPVDATANEVDYVDSGHIRVGQFHAVATAVNLKEVEVLEHRVLGDDGVAIDAATQDRLAAFVGRYAHASGQRTYRIEAKGGELVLVTPEDVSLALREQDHEGRRYSKLANHVYCRFSRDEHGSVDGMEVHEVLRARRRDDAADAAKPELPDELRGLPGAYRLAALRADFEVRCVDGKLAVRYPKSDTPVPFEPADGGRFTRAGKLHELSFDRAEDGTAEVLHLDVGDRFARVRPEDPEVKKVKALLLDYHEAAAAADAERFFACLAPDAVVFGTDEPERWTPAGLRELLGPSFARGVGFTTMPTAQNVVLGEGGKLAWFDERLRSTRYGAMRGSGVARKTGDGWQIVQYNQSFVVPNELVPDLVRRIKDLNAGR